MAEFKTLLLLFPIKAKTMVNSGWLGGLKNSKIMLTDVIYQWPLKHK